MVYVLLADGLEEIEALTPVDILRRGGVNVKTVGITGKRVQGSHGVVIEADISPADFSADDCELVILPGGMPGAQHLCESPDVDRILREASARGARLAAICAAPMVLGKKGYLRGLHAVCYPGFETELTGALPSDRRVETDGRVTTAVGMGASAEFALELLTLLRSETVARKIKTSAFLLSGDDLRTSI